jgi:hypothetical protein
MISTYFSDYSPASKLWIFQANQSLDSHAGAIRAQIQPFIESWLSHGAAVKGSYILVAHHFLLIAADEGQSTVSGCSTDGLMRAVQALGTELGVDFFDRTNLAFATDTTEGIQTTIIPLAEAKKGLPNIIEPTTLYYDLTPATVGQIQSGWPIEVQKTWLAKYLFAAA